MKKVFAGLLALVLLAQTCSAKVLIVEAKGSPFAFAEDGAETIPAQVRSIREAVAGILRGYNLVQGIDYDVVSKMPGVNVTNLLSGNVVVNPGLPAAYIKHYDALIVAVYDLKDLSPGTLDSLRKWESSTRYNSVPMLFLMYGSQSLAGNDSTFYGGDYTGQGAPGQVMYSTKNTAVRFTAPVSGMAPRNSAFGATAGTPRVLIAANQGRAEGTQQDIGNFGYTFVPCKWCDSLFYQTPSDTAVLWVRYMDHIPGAKPIVYDKFSDYGDPMNIPLMWAGMAFLDSLADGKVFGSNPGPSFGIMVPGAASRGLETGYPWSTGGITADDTTNAYNSVDSLATLGVPISWGAPANLDSITAYRRDLYKIMGASPNFRLFPFQRFGIDSAAAGNGATSRNRPSDLWGAWRNRTSIGDGSLLGVDSSLYSHASVAFSRLDSLYPGRVDHSIYAPVDKYNPKNFAGMGVDSMYSAFAKAGVKSIVTNFRIKRAQQGKVPSALQGERWTTSIANAPYSRAGKINILGTAPFDSGSARMDFGTGQVGQEFSYNNQTLQMYFWKALLGVRPRAFMPAAYGTDWNVDSTNTKHNVLVVPFASLQGSNRADRLTTPVRPGWWYIKSIVNAAAIINSYAPKGRTLVRILPVEQVDPK